MTCRRFSPAEAKAAGFLNRVVPVGRLATEAESLAAQVAAMPSVPIAITKEHVNSVARAMGMGSTAFSDGDGLLGAVFDPESLEAARKYLERTVGRRRG
jgi:enoyl-CoA hydratase/3-hydroxypropionyl-coenzyme A dehydratase